ncbi:MAG TPA: hypothetical protein VFM18_05690 [Methanosarcina sp.]|nr:hypothetical protein [Methanosarcina sp.]
MRINVTTRNEDGSVAFNASLNRAEVNTLLQYAVNNLMAMGFVFDTQVLPDEDDETVRFKKGDNSPTGNLN